MARAKNVTKVEVKQAGQKEMVNHPDHYQLDNGIEVIDYIEGVLTLQGRYQFDIGNALKYISRSGRKFDGKEDLKKAIWYLNDAIDCLDRDENRT